MKKRIFSILLVALLSGTLVACGDDTAETSSESDDETSTEFEVDDNDEGKQASADLGTITTNEQMLIENNTVSVLLTSVDAKSDGRYEVNLELENKSTDITYTFTVDDAYTDGVENDPFFVKDVAPGKKASATLDFDSLQDYGLDKFTDIEIAFRIYEDEDWFGDPLVKETFHVYPYGEENASTFTYVLETSDEVLIDNEYMTLIMTGHEDSYGIIEYIYIYFENKTDVEVMLSVDDCSVNGYMIEPYFATTLPAGKSKFTSISFDCDDLEEIGITSEEEIEEIEFEISLYDDSNILGDDFVDQVITITF